ncbi:MAG: 4'-phosphopantetheinyl transferase family protein [Massilia sp.]
MPSDLADNQVHLWLADPDQASLGELEARCYPLLGGLERDKYRSFHFDKDRRLYLAAHALTRLVLARYTRLAPTGIEFVHGPNGKPRAQLPPPHTAIRHNLSHTEGLVGCVLARRECGLDIEALRPLPALDAIAAQLCSAGELAQLAALGGAARERHFFRLWTLKEAYAKATGQGIGAGLRQVSFAIDKDEVSCSGAAGHWWFGCQSLPSGHALALAVDATPGPVALSLHRLALGASAP